MGLYEGRGNLSKALQQIERQWTETCTTWSDSRRKEFEDRFVRPLRADLMQTMSAMDTAAALLNKIRDECE